MPYRTSPGFSPSNASVGISLLEEARMSLICDSPDVSRSEGIRSGPAPRRPLDELTTLRCPLLVCTSNWSASRRVPDCRTAGPGRVGSSRLTVGRAGELERRKTALSGRPVCDSDPERRGLLEDVSTR